MDNDFSKQKCATHQSSPLQHLKALGNLNDRADPPRLKPVEAHLGEDFIEVPPHRCAVHRPHCITPKTQLHVAQY